MPLPQFKILLANPRGFCAGVDRAIDIVERALALLGPPVYVHHEIVHNRFVVEQLSAAGAVFVNHIEEIPLHSQQPPSVIFSAHGVSQKVRTQAKMLGLQVFDATCPLVIKVHLEVARYSRLGHECILIGHKGHAEVEGTLGQYHNPDGAIYLVESVEDVGRLSVRDPDHLGYVTQTTLSLKDTALIVSALQEKFPHIQTSKREDICYATQNRQKAVERLAQHSDCVIVVGSQMSSNSKRLKEVAQSLGCPAYLIDGAEFLEAQWVEKINTVGVTAGASTPEVLVEQIIDRLKSLGGTHVEALEGQPETILFALPKALRHSEKKKSTLL